MYCKIFPSQQVYDGITEMNIACDNVVVTDGWICLYKDEKFVASFDMMTIKGWVLVDSIADTPQTKLPKQIRTPYEGDIADILQTNCSGGRG